MHDENKQILIEENIPIAFQSKQKLHFNKSTL